LLEALEAGGRVLKRYADGIESDDIYYKDEINLVTKADLESESAILDVIRRAFPDHAVLTEEAGEVAAGVRAGKPSWVIDPLDGTTNFAHGFPVYCVSIAYLESCKPMLGGVYDPTRDELFLAARGRGATMNARAIRVSRADSLARSLLATGFPYDIKTTSENNLDYFAAFAMRAQAVRRAGSAALDLCYIACGRFDGFWELKLHPWDTAAAWLIVEEAGGKVTDFDGCEFDIFKMECAASNGTALHEEIIGVIGDARRVR
jgi:myo-inositol-1(or 4)-monophosphatase